LPLESRKIPCRSAAQCGIFDGSPAKIVALVAIPDKDFLNSFDYIACHFSTALENGRRGILLAGTLFSFIRLSRPARERFWE
jgi:hypothetical protein